MDKLHVLFIEQYVAVINDDFNYEYGLIWIIIQNARSLVKSCLMISRETRTENQFVPTQY